MVMMPPAIVVAAVPTVVVAATAVPGPPTTVSSTMTIALSASLSQGCGAAGNGEEPVRPRANLCLVHYLILRNSYDASHEA